MARRINSYQLLKRIHLYASMIVFVFLLMYIISGFFMINYCWFSKQDAMITKNKVPFCCDGLNTNAELIYKIKNSYAITGRTSAGSVKKDSTIQWHIRRPGVEHQITLSANRDSIAVIRTEQQTFMRILSRLHHLRGYSDGVLYKIWAFMYDLSAIAFIVFSITGMYMWYRLRKKYKAGWIFLAIGILVPVIVIIYFL